MSICTFSGCDNKARRRGFCDKHRQDESIVAASEQVAADRARLHLVRELATVKERYKAALKTIEQLESEQHALQTLKDNIDIVEVKPHYGSGTSEATPVILASDWHIEESVGAEVSGLNHYTLDIAQERVTKFFQGSLRLVQLLNKDVAIHTVVLGLLGDYITNDIHGAENAEKNQLQPTHAIVTAQNMIISGLECWLDNSDYTFVIVCKVGNHGRTTITTRFAAENGHSLEFLMYLTLQAYFRNEPRVQFVIDDGYHSYLDVYDRTIRFHHGHAIRYAGGVGGIFIPTYKAIAQWNKGRTVNLDVFGHFHQMKDGGNFICNGSLIGWNAFANSIKADYEIPMQTLFLIDKKRGRTATWPIMVGEGKR